MQQAKPEASTDPQLLEHPIDVEEEVAHRLLEGPKDVKRRLGRTAKAALNRAMALHIKFARSIISASETNLAKSILVVMIQVVIERYIEIINNIAEAGLSTIAGQW